MWVLTGDKIETAINIATSCQLLKQNQTLAIVDGVSEREVNDALNKGLNLV